MQQPIAKKKTACILNSPELKSPGQNALAAPILLHSIIRCLGDVACQDW